MSTPLAEAPLPSTSGINRFCLDQGLRIIGNPCISPDFCLDWPSLRARLLAAPRAQWAVVDHGLSRFQTSAGRWLLLEDADGDHAWLLEPRGESSGAARELLLDGVDLGGIWAYPASWANLLRLKNLVQEHDPGSTIFPTATPELRRRSLGVGARFTTMHWPAVQWTMARLGLPMNANQNSIPRELVFDVDAMLSGRLESVPFPFIGAAVPEGHQGQSVEGMSHGAVISGLTTGFHQRRIPWGFNADHQPIGGRFDVREDQLVRGCLLATSITFDLSPELERTTAPADAAEAGALVRRELGEALLLKVLARIRATGVAAEDDEVLRLLALVWPAVRKMQRRDRLYAQARARAFSTEVGRAYIRELSIDELPGLTSPATLATMLALTEELGMHVDFLAPAFGFQKNFPFSDDAELARRVEAAWAVCRCFGASIGFHSGSGKSQANYRVLGRTTGGMLEIKTSGRYTYEFGQALARSSHPQDQELWRAWWAFTRDLALGSAFNEDQTERRLARSFISHALMRAGEAGEVFTDPASCRQALARLSPDPDHMFWFEYNFLFVLAAGGRPDKAALGDHGPAGYRQRGRFYAVSEEARLHYAGLVASYLVMLAETTGLADAGRCAGARLALHGYRSYAELLAEIAQTGAA